MNREQTAMNFMSEATDWRTKCYFMQKRVLDVVVSTILLLCLIPLFAIVMICIKICSVGPMLYWQARVGEGGHIIHFPKFRSMYISADRRRHEIEDESHHENSHTFKMKKDPRITLIGRFIRRYSIDELPQLWLVFRGDLTQVGPRPALPEEVQKYTGSERMRLLAKPGLTCIWQVSGRGDIPFKEQCEMDCEYIRQRSFRMDLKLLVQTVPAVFGGKGAY